MGKTYSKKGLSAIVATVMIILITIVAAAILSGVVLPFIRTNLASSTECVSYKGYFTFNEDMGYTCSDGSLIGFSVNAGTLKQDSLAPNGFEVVFVGTGTSKSALVVAGNSTSSSVAGIRLLDKTLTTLTVPTSGEVETYVFNPGNNVYNQIKIFPMIQSGRICDQSDSIDIKSCIGMGVSLTP
jgi:flagellin-like protein